MIELKTEAGSHRPAQIPLYFELGRHHYPRHRIDSTYLTGPLSKGAPLIPDGCRFGHVTWSDVMPFISDVWANRSPTHGDVVRALDEVLDGLITKWSAWRAERIGVGSTVEPPPPDPTGDALGSFNSWQLITSSALSTSPLPALRTFNRFGSRCVTELKRPRLGPAARQSMALALGEQGTTTDQRRMRDRLRATPQLVPRAGRVTDTPHAGRHANGRYGHLTTEPVVRRCVDLRAASVAREPRRWIRQHQADWWTMTNDQVWIRVETHCPPDDRLTVHVTEDDAPEVFDDLRGVGLDVQGPLLQLSIPEIVQVAMEVGGALSPLAAGLRAYWHRNDKKTIKFTFNGTEIDLSGYSEKEAEKLFQARKKDWDEGWRQQLAERDRGDDSAT